MRGTCVDSVAWTVLTYGAAAAVIGCVACGLGTIVVAPLLLVLCVLVVVLPIIATIRASDGRPYRDPLTMRLIDGEPVRSAFRAHRACVE